MVKLLKRIKHAMSIEQMVNGIPLKKQAAQWLDNLVTCQTGSMNIGGLVMLFMAALMLMALTPSLVDANAVIQTDTGSGDMVKMIMNLLVWAIPLGGGVGIIMAAINLFKND
ncbi:hypothetical protein CY91_00965 [Dehalococcoides mccartyi]|uniref:Uncharacterized protein n=1 Tax=Dehalococcoides mccartyi TaxID=61435 RepID=A0A2J1DUU0_9CHLR|nr:hypothetical protein [Dehalococcoides mccartyi]AOV98743.1 hypothetical protein DCWBC2_0066 [Dehalococcoides mccartyi]AQX74038.1 hypothetical protein B1776_00340 [Dehalococcoides mccartyi]AQY72551.1 hypothetical protein B1772_00330 [Dehalococcoides mccartyi]KSV17354.1 hypothetical protein CY91_00965 [Dehalococcoides mccartyi]MBA2084505.1 hypothetical protein [Dehalococcoides mccartyi]